MGILKLHRARATYLPGANVLHWTFAIARSVYVSRLRYWRSRPEALGLARDIAEGYDGHAVTAHAETPEAELAAQHLHMTLTAELNAMSEKNRVAYILMKEENLTIVSPDAGGAERARAYAKRLDAELAIVDKRRTEDGTAEVIVGRARALGWN